MASKQSAVIEAHPSHRESEEMSEKRAKPFEGQVVLVTGAGSGIGKATAEAFGAQGATVVLVARSHEKIHAVAEGISKNGGSAMAVEADVASADALTLVADKIENAFSRLDILVTCAAAQPASGPSETLPFGNWQQVMDIDLTGTFLSCQAAGRMMLEKGYGRIVNVASFHVTATYPERTAYVAAKAGVVGMTEALAVEWGGRGITVNAVAPGPILTPRTQWFLSQDPKNEQGMIGRTPTGRLGTVEEVAATILFLCSREAGHVNGQTITIDGGWTKNAWWGQHPWKG